MAKRRTKTVWKDDGAIKPKTYKSRGAVLNLIRRLLSKDKDLLRGRDVNKISDDDLFETGFLFYNIYSEEVC